MLRLEKVLDECLEQLKVRFEMDTHDDLDELESIASSGLGANAVGLRTSVVRFTGQQQEVERLRSELSRVERENASLREEVQLLRGGRSVGSGGGGEDEEEKKHEDAATYKPPTTSIRLTERDVWKVVKRSDVQQ